MDISARVFTGAPRPLLLAFMLIALGAPALIAVSHAQFGSGFGGSSTNPPIVVTVNPSSASAESGGAVTFTVTVSGGTGVYTSAYADDQYGNQVGSFSGGSQFSGSTSFSIGAECLGGASSCTNSLTFHVTDTDGGTGSSNPVTYTVTAPPSSQPNGGSSNAAGSGTAAAPQPLQITSISPSSQSASSGQSVTYTVTATGGAAGARYSVTVTDPSGTQLGSSLFPFSAGASSAISVAETNPSSSQQSYTLTFTLSDDSGDAPVQRTATLVVGGTQQAPSSPSGQCGSFGSGQLAVSVDPQSPSTQSLSQSFVVSVSGATCSYTLTVEGQGGTPVYSSTPGITASPYTTVVSESNPGTYSLSFFVEDYAGHQASAPATLTVGASAATSPSTGGPLAATVTSPAASVTGTAQATFVVRPSGGQPPYYLTVRRADNGGTVGAPNQQISSPDVFYVSSSAFGAGQHTLNFYVTDSNQNQAPVQTGTFTVTSSLSLNPSSGPAGSTVSFTVHGMAPDSKATLNMGGTALKTSPSSLTTDSSGSLTGTFTVPSGTTGSQTITASDGAGDSATATFTVAAASSSSNPSSPSGPSSPSSPSGPSTGSQTQTLPNNQAGICLSSSGSAGCVSASTTCVNPGTLPPGTDCEAQPASAGLCPSSAPDLCVAVTSATPSGPTGQTGPSGQQLSAIQQQIGKICNSIESIVFILGLALMLLGGAVYAGSHVMPGQTRGQIQGYGMSMLMGGIVGVIIALLAPWVLNEVITLSNSGVPQVSCTSAGSIATGTTATPISPSGSQSSPSSPSGGGQQSISVSPNPITGAPGDTVQITVTVTDPNPPPYYVAVSDSASSKVWSFQIPSTYTSGNPYAYSLQIPINFDTGSQHTLTFTFNDGKEATGSTSATLNVGS